MDDDTYLLVSQCREAIHDLLLEIYNRDLDLGDEAMRYHALLVKLERMLK
jgi:hypothetical protein